MIKKVFRSGFIGANFTPAGIFAGLAISSAIALYSFPLISDQRFSENIEITKNKIAVLIDGVVGYHGYMHSTVSPCSDAITVSDISARRLNDCKDFSVFEVVDLGGDDTIGEESYFKVLGQYGDNRIYFDDDPLDNTSFYIFLDFQSTKNIEAIERIMGSWIRERYPDMLRDIEWEAVSVTNGSGGTLRDGKVRFRFVK